MLPTATGRSNLHTFSNQSEAQSHPRCRRHMVDREQYTYITFVGILATGALVCATAPSSTALIVGRAVQGIGGAGVLNGAFAVISSVATPQERPCEQSTSASCQIPETLTPSSCRRYRGEPFIVRSPIFLPAPGFQTMKRPALA
jgi:hypothetical protein